MRGLRRKIAALGVSVVGVSGCSGGPGDDAGSASASSSGSSSSTGESASSTSAGASETGASEGTISTSAATSTGAPTSTTGAALCDFDEVVCALAEQLGGALEDCGAVDPWVDSAAAWQAAQGCALTAASGQKQFKLITTLQGIDSEVRYAYVGQAARSFAITALFYDSDPCGGGGCGPQIRAASCEGLIATPGCTVEPGSICLTCAGQGALTPVCGPE